MEKTYSQKVARTFEIIDYILLLPSLAMALLVLPVSTANFERFSIGVVVWTMVIFGCWLMSGYFRHSRGTLSSRGDSMVWIGTIVYNSIFLLVYLLPTLALLAKSVIDNSGAERFEWQPLALLFPFIMLWSGAVVFSWLALKDVRARRKLQ